MKGVEKLPPELEARTSVMASIENEMSEKDNCCAGLSSLSLTSFTGQPACRSTTRQRSRWA